MTEPRNPDTSAGSAPTPRPDATLPLPMAGEASGGAGATEPRGPHLAPERADSVGFNLEDEFRGLPRHFGRFQILEELGRGGMGVVYLAYHPELRVHFAVKVLLAGDQPPAELLSRFEREARALARIRHPGFVAVHDLGVADGRAFIAMEYVEGVSLERLLEDPVGHGVAEAGPGSAPAPVGGSPAGPIRVRSRRGARGIAPREAAGMIAEVAESLQAAHEAGILHRDLKPANILRDRAGRLKIMDFGIAKMTGAGTLQTQAGAVMGTPSYMSPEQASGDVDRMDERSDVYQLGAVLYEMLTGTVPHDGPSPMAIAMSVLKSEPARVRVRSPWVPVGLAAIVEKAMERESRQRYSTAQSLALDLRRWLAGEPTEARPPSWWKRPVRWLHRHRGPAALGGVALVCLIAAVLAVVRWRGAEARRWSDLADRAALYRKAAIDLRREGLSLERKGRDYLALLGAAVTEAEAADPSRPEPRWHLGRLQRALMDFRAARAAQEEALRRDPEFAPARYEHAVLLAAEYRARIDRLRDAWWASAGAQRPSGPDPDREGGSAIAAGPPPSADLAAADPVAGALRRALREDLKRLEAATGRSGDDEGVITSAMRRCARGLYLSGEASGPEGWAASAEELEAALAADPGLEEAVEALAALRRDEGKPAAAVAVYTRGIEADRGYAPFRSGRAGMWTEEGMQRFGRGEDPGAAFTAALEDFAQALETAPDVPATWVGRGMTRLNRGVWIVLAGGDPTSEYEAAVADFGQALARAPDLVDALSWRGSTRSNLARHREERGVDPGDAVRLAREDFDRALELDPRASGALRGRANLLNNIGLAKRRRGEDPTPDYQAAIADYGRALALDPRSEEAWVRRGLARVNLGVYVVGRGGDPLAWYDEAIADFGQAIERFPREAEGYLRRGTARCNRAIYRASRGADARPDYAAALSDLDAAVERNPRWDEAWRTRGILRARHAVDARQQGEDPTPLYEAAMADFGEAIRVNPAQEENWTERGQTRLNWAIGKLAAFQLPAGLLEAAEADFTAALERNPARDMAWQGRGHARRLAAMLGAMRGKDPAAGLAAALDDLDRAVRANPGNAVSFARRGSLHVVLGNDEKALSDFASAAALDPASTASYAMEIQMARARLTQRKPEEDLGED